MLVHDEVFDHFSNTHHCPFKSFTAIGMVCEAKSMCSRVRGTFKGQQLRRTKSESA